MYALLASLLLTTVAADAPAEKNRSNIRSMPVIRTPEATTVVLAIAVPKADQVVSNPVWIQFRIDGFALGAASSQFDRANELVNSKMGQTVHVVIDDRPYFPINEPAIDPFDEGGYYYDMSYKFQVPFRLSEGKHVVRMFPARSFGECLKGDKTFQAMTFYVGKEKDNLDIDLSQPYITYNEPSNEMYLVEGRPILLDFYVSNTELSPDGYRVRLTVDGKVNRTLSFWQPYYIYGLKKGKHTVRLELLDPTGQLVPGMFNNVQQSFTVH
jgi:hypothetical protein